MAISFNSSTCSSNKSIKSAKIDSDGNLVVTYSDDTAEIIGKVVGADGKDFKPDAQGNLIPDGTMYVAEPQGFVYQSYANGVVTLYFKTSLPGVSPVTWVSAEYGKGDKGDPFNIDGSGTTLPDPQGLEVGYTFLNTDTGMVYIKQVSLQWSTGYQWKGDRGEQGQFRINDRGTTLPATTGLYDGYTFLKTDEGKLYYVYEDGTGALLWSAGDQFTGPQGVGIQGPVGPAAEYIISNTVDFSLANTLIVIGTCPEGYVVTNIDVNIATPLNTNVVDMEIRFGGTVQDDTGSVIIAEKDYFDLNRQSRYIVNEINHEPSTKDEIVSAVFDYAPLNSDTGIVKIKVTIGKQLPTSNIPI
ncbi:hypothetical protein XaC1_304 [Xanthomonas phage XaC1]|nr:hypothetical protein XaC1_304 [Xanthomonas phage XaC1]